MLARSAVPIAAQHRPSYAMHKVPLQQLQRKRCVFAQPARQNGVRARAVLAERALDARPAAPEPQTADPWNNEKWTKYKWTVYRGVAYDLTAYMNKHPGGNFLINLAIGRDCTALFESYHLRPEVAVAHLKRLPVLEEFPVAAVPRSPYPNDSPIYNKIRERVRKEVFKGEEVRGAHRSGSEGAILAVLGFTLATYSLYTWDANILTGGLYGLAGAWIGLTIQHCGNHGAMSTNPLVNLALGFCDDLSGGSSLMWRYHHQVSHHIHCNDESFDEDVFSAFPLLRFDPRQPKAWYHRFQHLYMWAVFPLLTLIFQVGDWNAFFTRRTPGASLYGVDQSELNTFVVGKMLFYWLLLAMPALLHGPEAALWGAAGYVTVQSIVLSSTFAVSHNIPEAKPLDANPTRTAMEQQMIDRDWGAQQILTSANWGGVVGNFFTGGLNLQIEHHLFPAISFMHYPAIAKIVAEEAKKAGVTYAQYDTLPQILSRFMQYMAEVGVAPEEPERRDAVQLQRL